MLQKLLFICFFTTIILCKESSGYDRNIVAARVESCRGCSLNRLPEVKQFIYDDLPRYADSGVEFKPIHGAPPELALLSSAGEEIDRLPLSKLTRLECNELLEQYGFRLKDAKEKSEF